MTATSDLLDQSEEKVGLIDDQTSIKLPQNIQALIGEIGEKQVLLRLAILAHQNGWGVYHNLGEAGYDILLLKNKSEGRIRIEVKTRQKLYTTGSHINQVHFFLTNGEHEACDFLVAYFLDRNSFYVVPKDKLKKVVVNGLNRWRFTVTLNKQKEPHLGEAAEFLNAWHTLHPDFNSMKGKLGPAA